jgi:hypothetical protein
MRGKRFVLGILTGVALTLLVGAILAAIVLTRPVPDVSVPPSQMTGDIVISLSEGYLDDLATSLARRQEPSIQRVVVDVRPDGRLDITLLAQVNIVGIRLGVQIKPVAVLQAEDGRLRFAVQRISLVGPGISMDMLPGSMREAVSAMESMVNGDANGILTEAGLVPVSVVTGETTLTIGLRAE